MSDRSPHAPTPGETDLDRLLRSMSPELQPGIFVFVSLPEPVAGDLRNVALATIRESEGTTLVIPEAAAIHHRLAAVFPCRQITLKIHSSLAAVGLTAAFAGALAAAGLSCNTIAGFHHDHLFVPVDDAERAMGVLQRLSMPVASNSG